MSDASTVSWGPTILSNLRQNSSVSCVEAGGSLRNSTQCYSTSCLTIPTHSTVQYLTVSSEKSTDQLNEIKTTREQNNQMPLPPKLNRNRKLELAIANMKRGNLFTMREVLDTLSSGKRAAHPRNTRGQVLLNTQDTALGVTGCLIHLKHTSFNPESLEGRHHCHPPQSVSTERHWSYCWTLNAIGINEGGRGSKWEAVIKTASPWFVTTY